jgi:hypothetical protein
MHPQFSARSLVLSFTALVAFGATVLASAGEAIRIRAGTTEKHTDANGVMWLADQGFTDGDTVDLRSGALQHVRFLPQSPQWQIHRETPFRRDL